MNKAGGVLWGQRWRWWGAALCGALILHGGTALLRLGAFSPFPEAVDFSSYYAGAWSLRMGLSPYPWPERVIYFLQENFRLPAIPPPLNSPPAWAWLMLPFTVFWFPTAAWVWLGVSLALTVACHVRLARMAGWRRPGAVWLALPITFTFGPLFLNLTLGQNGIVLLACLIVMLRELEGEAKPFGVRSAAAWTIAVAAKVYPLLWLGAYAAAGRWRQFWLAGMLAIIVFTAATLAAPAASADYWLAYLPGQSSFFAKNVSIDDQSLHGWLTRLLTDGEYAFPGLSTDEMRTVKWDLPWAVPGQFVRLFSGALLAALAGWLAYGWYRHRADPAEILMALVLFGLLVFPHMARYNHVLVLPAMARLWATGQDGRRAAISGYALFGLARLNHLWALLPALGGAPLSGAGTLGVLVLLLVGARPPRDSNP